MSNPTDTMKAALIAAGRTVPDDASADDIELAHMELEAEREAAEAARAEEEGRKTLESAPPDDAPLKIIDGIGPDGQIYKDGVSIGIAGSDGPCGGPEPSEVVTLPATSGVSSASRRETYEQALARLGTPEAGSKTPAVIEWARANLSKEEFAAKYPRLA